MQLNSRFLAALTSIAVGILANATPISSGYTTNVNYTGLYDSSGTQLTSAVSVTGCRYTLTYCGENATSPLTGAVYYHPFTELPAMNPYWGTRINVVFNSNTWTQYPTATVGIQVLNYLYTRYTNPVSMVVGAPVHWFVEPNATSLITPPPTPRSSWSANVVFNDVNPRLFTISQFSVDLSDPTGKTGYVDYYPGLSTNLPEVNYPWDTVYPYYGFLSFINAATNASFTQHFIGVIWCFPRVGYNGFSSANRPVIYDYPISAS